MPVVVPESYVSDRLSGVPHERARIKDVREQLGFNLARSTDCQGLSPVQTTKHPCSRTLGNQVPDKRLTTGVASASGFAGKFEEPQRVHPRTAIRVAPSIRTEQKSAATFMSRVSPCQRPPGPAMVVVPPYFDRDHRVFLDDRFSGTCRVMAALCHFSHSVLAEAASGKIMPTWPVVKAFVQACGADDDEVQNWETYYLDTQRAVGNLRRKLGEADIVGRCLRTLSGIKS
jgi:hypothetical protein